LERKLQSIKNHLKESARLKQTLAESYSESILQPALVMTDCLENGGKILLCGNGGSAADAQHFAAELVGRLKRERPAIPAVALTTDTSILTAVGNDYGITEVFRRQVLALGRDTDVLLAISTSGNSVNVVHAVQAAQEKSIRTLGLLGHDGGELADLTDYHIIVPSHNSQFVQEAHISIIHMWCELIENAIHPI